MLVGFASFTDLKTRFHKIFLYKFFKPVLFCPFDHSHFESLGNIFQLFFSLSNCVTSFNCFHFESLCNTFRLFFFSQIVKYLLTAIILKVWVTPFSHLFWQIRQHHSSILVLTPEQHLFNSFFGRMDKPFTH